MRSLLIFSFILVCSTGIFSQSLGPFLADEQPPAPDYSQEKYWSALPFRQDAADVIPRGEAWISDSLKEVDVFYIYPTIYKQGTTWCADVNDEKLNRKIDHLPVHFQASVFNASARVYAPRYRQANIAAYYDSINGPKALEFAYEDVRRAFKYYMEHYNHGRPIIIASHSQGSNHAWRLLREFFDTTTLRSQLVCAYVVGMGVDQHSYQALRPCANASQTGCYVTWASFKDGYDPHHSILYGNVAVNPITWTRDTTLAPKSETQGAVFLKIKHKWKHAVSAQLHHNYLWVETSMPFVRSWNVLHLMDYNLFWFDIRKNVAERVKAWEHK